MLSRAPTILELCRLPLCRLPLCRLPLCRLPLGGLPFGGLPFGGLPFGGLRLGALPPASLPLTRLAIAGLTALALAACSDGPSAGQLRIELVDEAGDNAARGIASGTLSVEVRQGDTLLMCPSGPTCETEIRMGNFNLALPFQSLTASTTIKARIEGGPTPLVGAMTGFEPFGEMLDTGAVPLRLLMVPETRCVALDLPPANSESDMALARGRRDAAVATRRNLVLVVGGVEASGTSSSVVDFYDQVVLEVLAQDPLDLPAGPSRGIALSEDVSLVVGDHVYLFELAVGGPPRARRLAGVHEGAGFASAVVRSPGAGATIVGGDGPGLVSRLAANGVVLGTAALTTPRRFAVATSVRNGLLVVGGAEPGEPVVEWLPESSDATPLALDPAGVPLPDAAAGGWLVPSPRGTSALWIGADDQPQTYLITGCPSACLVRAGAPWVGARPEATGTRTAAGDFWIVGGSESRAVDIVRWDDEETPRVVTGPELTAPRAGAMIFEHAFGSITVTGGQNVGGMLDDFEQCTPSALDPI